MDEQGFTWRTHKAGRGPAPEEPKARSFRRWFEPDNEVRVRSGQIPRRISQSPPGFHGNSSKSEPRGGRQDCGKGWKTELKTERRGRTKSYWPGTRQRCQEARLRSKSSESNTYQRTGDTAQPAGSSRCGSRPTSR